MIATLEGAACTAAGEATGMAPAQVLEAFGEFIVPGLLAMYGAYLSPGWRTLEVLEQTEETIHRVVRRQSSTATPPWLAASRTSPNEVLIRYSSERRLCALARGIVRGVAKHFHERVEIEEPSCMLSGGQVCELVIRKLD